MKEETKKVLKKLGIVLVVVIPAIAALIPILSFCGIHELNDLLLPKPPKFDFQYEGLLEPNAPIYEVTEQLRGPTNLC